MDIRQLNYLVVLAREQHFTRAAALCGVTQPTLSARIRQLEEEFGIPIVKRGHRYHGLTPEGEQIVQRASSILESWEAMQQDLSRMKGELTGRVTLGVIPSALPLVAVLTRKVGDAFPGIGFSILSMSSEDIRLGLERFELDAGITYLDNEPLDQVRTAPLFRERLRLITPESHPLSGSKRVSWAEAAAHPLALLTPDMQNRRIVNAAFLAAGVNPSVRIETNSIIALVTHVRDGQLAAVLPELSLQAFGSLDGIAALELVEPSVDHNVGLVVADRDPMSPLVETVYRSALAIEFQPDADQAQAPSSSGRVG
ncbi:LysR family transcriptional regulator [Amorphus orientalis]|uniref:DNA-binding transcriptional LysR family regulator n=1 Tax=Amorphus orientalis TaxID=649198 RepID=A0AAE3VPS6_9HYPH|nr:LysR family transcriptional regulator [Amorphus orientalis]MDQ0315998.1 DNA-binding transcriptional LysR family regulator [Amorphus orientalis]